MHHIQSETYHSRSEHIINFKRFEEYEKEVERVQTDDKQNS